MRAHTPSPKQRAVRHDHGGARLAALTPQFPHDQLQEQDCGLGSLLVFREIALDAFFLLAAKRGVRKNHVHAVALADVGELEAKGVAGVNLRGVEAVQ